MVRIGIAGVGFMGVTHFKAIEKVTGAKVTAIFTRNPKKLSGDWRQVQGNFGGSGGVQFLKAVNCHDTIEALFADDSVDLVDICLPTHLHSTSTLAAFRAGKHVLLEKPISLVLSEADGMMRAAKKARRHFLVAHVLRFFPEFAVIKELADSGRYGRIQAAHFKRIISKPAWKDVREIARMGGPAIDLHIHDADFVQYLFGMPSSVTTNGLVQRSGLVEHLNTHYHFGRSSMAISAEAGWLSQQACPFEHGYDIYFEKAALKFNSSSAQAPVLLTDDGKSANPRLPRKDGFVAELQEAVDVVGRKKRGKSILAADSARNSLKLCLSEIRSAQTGRKVTVKKN